MQHRIAILHLEENSLDAALINEGLETLSMACDVVHAPDRESFEGALAERSFDLILLDYNIPDYDGISALRLVRQKHPAVPVIVISDSLGEDDAVQCLQEGATDYLLKHRLEKLGPAVRRALHEAEEQRRRSRTEEALRESEERFRQLAETIEDVFWSTTPDGQTLVYVSPAFERVWGRSLAELQDKPTTWIDAIHSGDRTRVLDALEHLAKGVNYEIEFRIQRLDGNDRWILDRGYALRDAAGVVYRTVGVARDITRRKLAEEAHRMSEKRFATIFQSSPVAIGFGTIDGRLIDVNPQYCEFFGYRRQDMVGETEGGLGLWAKPEERVQIIEKLRNEKVIRNHEVRFRRKSGETRTALLSVETLQLENQLGILATIVDITERRELESQLRRAQRVESVGRLASGIAHDMNNILAPIMMSTPLLRMKMSAQEVEKTLSTIEASAQRGAALVRQLMIFGRGVEGERRPVRLADSVAEVIKMAGQTFPRNIKIVTNVAQNVWPVQGDATQIHQVLLNLCVNARDAMPEGGTLTIAAENIDIEAHYAAQHPDAKPGRYVLIRVQDTGVGIALELFDQVFDPFFITKEIGRGTGLGLSTVTGIVKSHGGFARLKSEVGYGAVFEIYLPASSEVKAAASPTEAAAPIRGHGELIMVVDDEEHLRAILRETLTRHNYKVVTAQDGVEATAVFAANRARLVVTDLDMPLMDGVNLTRVLRQMDPAVKIVISTGLDERSGEGRRQAKLDALDVSAILTKPYTAEKILRAVHTALTEAEGSAPPN